MTESNPDQKPAKANEWVKGVVLALGISAAALIYKFLICSNC